MYYAVQEGWAVQLELLADGDAAPLRFFSTEIVIVGREEGCELRIDADDISRRHALMVFEVGAWRVYDLHSQNGVYVNNARVGRAELQTGDRLWVGEHGYQVRLVDMQAERNEKLRSRRGLFHRVPETIGSFSIQERLHCGASGDLYKAKWTLKDRIAVVKVFAPEIAADEELMFRFCRGVAAAGKIHHPNVVRLFRGGKEDNIWFLAMEWMVGGSLRDKLERGGPLACDWVIRIGRDMAAALEAAVEHQVVHRAVTPSSILFDAKGNAKLGDFLLMRGVSMDLHSLVTKAGQVIGDMVYSSPEQIAGQTVLDIRTDIYSLGASLYEAMTGRPPFMGDNPVELLQMMQRFEFPKPTALNPTIPACLEAVVLRCMERSPDDRFPNPTALREAIEHCADMPAHS